MSDEPCCRRYSYEVVLVEHQIVLWVLLVVENSCLMNLVAAYRIVLAHLVWDWNPINTRRRYLFV